MFPGTGNVPADGVQLMAEDDPFRTLRDVSEPVTEEELRAAGFTDAEEIGRGGFGVVYRCTQPELDRTVAVKVLTAELDSENRARFFREQQAMGRLTGHPNVVTVLQSGTTERGRPFLVMPYHAGGSLDAQVHRDGPLRLGAVLWIGVKIAGALESAHRLGIVHRDVKPGNILLTDYGEPALTDFGIARIAGGFQTTSGMLTGSPAFTAPEVLEGQPSTPATDVYGLGATLFCALTGHAAFERRDGENVVTQFLRITTQPVPDLRDSGIPDDLSAVVAAAMSRDPRQRPSPMELGEALRKVQRRHGFAAEEMALRAEPGRRSRDQTSARGWHPSAAMFVGRRGSGALPLELTSFVDRRTELAEVRKLLTSARLVTLAGIGGVGKTRLALRVASTVREDFADGVWLVELADVPDSALLIAVVAASLGVRDESARPLPEMVVEFLSDRTALLVLDNCEQVAAAAAGLVETWLQACPDLRILATTREPLDIAGEAVLRVSPLPVPDPDQEPSVRDGHRTDAVTLFVDRAKAVVPTFELTEDNRAAAARICARLDGLPLAIELAAARIRTMSPDQILQRLDDRYALLTRGSRTAPTRQQTLRWCIDWSYQLCDSTEQRLWARLSVFVGGFELDAAEDVCGTGLESDSPLDVVSSLVDKSILIRAESSGVVRFRMLESVREFGRQKLRELGEYADLCQRHCDWYERLVLDAEADWISDRQDYWIARLDREQPNLREALEYCSTRDSERAGAAGLRIAAALYLFWNFRGMYGEARSCVRRSLNHPARQPVPDCIKAIAVGCIMAAVQGDLREAATLLKRGRALAEQAPTPMNRTLIAYCDGAVEFYRGKFASAATFFERAVEGFGADQRGPLYVAALTVLGWTHELAGDTRRALEYHRAVFDITEARGELMFRSSALRDMGVAAWREGERSKAIEFVENALRVNRRMGSPVVAALSLEALAWMVVGGDGGDAERAAVLMGAVNGLWRSMGNPDSIFPMPQYHDECVRVARSALGTHGFDSAFRSGEAMGMEEAVSYALGEQLTPPRHTSEA